MRNAFLALFLLVGTTYATESYSQNLRVTVVSSGISTAQVLSEIESQTDYLFVYDVNEVDLGRKVNVDAENRPVSEVLDEVFEGTGITYAMEGKNIMLMKESGQQQDNNQVIGIVKDVDGNPIIGANVIIKGKSVGTITDMDGRFTLNASVGEELQVTYIGFIPQNVRIEGKREIVITLIEDNKALDEVVVVGYGSQKKVNLTGAVTSVKSDLLENRTTSSAVNIITGQMPGVTVVQSNGQPGFDTGSLRVRGVGTMGNADAMVVVDGVESSLDVVDPNDIETITVLKDAAASAIYGVRAANGVILVTTKKGHIGKPTVTYNAYVGWQSITRHPEYLGSADYATLLNEAYRNDGLPEPYSADEIELFRNGTDPDHYPNTDWFNSLFNRSGVFHNHHISLSGGTEHTKYSVSMGYHNKEGLMANTGFRRFNMRFNIDTE